MGVTDIMRVVCFTNDRWRLITRAAATVDEASDKATNTSRIRPDFNLVGIAGEAVYAEIAGHPYDPLAVAYEKIRNGLRDGGIDFPPRVDVKATGHRPPWLKVNVSSRLRADYYALVMVDLSIGGGAYLGYATREQVVAAPIVKLQDEEGSYVLAYDALTKALP